MFGWIKQQVLKSKQGGIVKNFPGVNIVLHPDMPSPSMSKMADLAGIVYKVNSFEETISGLSDAQLKEKTDYFRQHISDKARECASQIEQLEAELFEVAIPEEKDRIKEKIKSTRNKIFEDILAESFAVVREASKRAIGLRHFDVQIAGGVILHEGKISEMSTGEGKTLVATLAAYLNALLGKGVHIVTVNDYLARRDREWMGPVFEFLGLTVGVIQHEMDDQERQAAYNCDITYGTNNEFGFDYLRDNMKYNLEDLVQRGFYFAIVDEVDSILIDEARTPLIISGPAEEATDKYYTARHIADSLKGRRVLEKDEINAKHKGIDLTKGYEYLADEKARTISLTEDGESRAAKLWGVESLHNIDTMEFRHHTIQALRAKEFFQRDVDYVVKDGEVIIVDEFTGRMMPGRRWSDGLHQAVEAKEGIKIERENQTLATVTFQNYFRMYEKLSGMTGTASTEANEFKDIYRLDVVNVPTNRPLIRHNYPDCIYRTEKEKFKAVVDEICELHEKGRPVLVGTVSIDKSEKLSEMLKMRGIEHEVLNAKHHEREAQIVAQAGHYKAVTIATNMAGRGTDILLGGNPDFLAKSFIQHKLDQEAPDYNDQVKKALQDFKQSCLKEHEQVVALDGLHVLATERHEARRIDNQLRGRCARQGDPGSSRFYISLEDNLMRLFGSDKISGMMAALGLEEGQVIEHPWVTRSIEVAQKRVEQHNFEIRKQLLDYDNVMNKQREVIYAQRRDVLEGLSLKDSILDVAGKIIEEKVNAYVASENDPEARDFQVVFDEMRLKLGIEIEKKDFEKSAKDAAVYLLEKAQEYYNNKEQAIGEKMLRHLERMVFLQIIDTKWKEHLYAMDSLREGIGLRAYGQRDPLIEYKREAFEMFAEMIATIEEEAAEIIFKLQPQSQQEKFKQVFSARSQRMLHPDAEGFPEQGQAPGDTGSNINAPVAQQQATSEKVGRNQPCPCGSGKKYKKCCGK